MQTRHWSDCWEVVEQVVGKSLLRYRQAGQKVRVIGPLEAFDCLKFILQANFYFLLHRPTKKSDTTCTFLHKTFNIQLAQLCQAKQGKRGLQRWRGCKFTSESKHSSNYVGTFKAFENIFWGCFHTFFALFSNDSIKIISYFQSYYHKTCSKSIFLFPSGGFVFTRRYCEAGQSTHPRWAFLTPLASPPHVCMVGRRHDNDSNKSSRLLTWCSEELKRLVEIWSRWSHFPKVGHCTQFGSLWLKD